MRIAVDRPVTVMVTAILVVVFGALSIADLPIQLTPDISVPTLTVRTGWPGSSPTEVETEILEPQEDALKDVPGLIEMTGEARSDQGSLALEFAVGTDIDDALVRVSNRLTEVGGYPEAADEPSVQTADSTGPPIAVIAVRSPRGEPVDAYRTWLEDRILPELQRIEGVGDARLLGGRDRVLVVDFDPAALASRGVRVAQLIDRVRSELRDVSGGDMTLGRHRLLVRTMAVDATPEQLDDIVIAAGPDGTPIRVRDVGASSLTLREPAGVAMSDDRPSLVLLVDREAGSNVLEVTERIRAAVERLDREVFAPEALRIEVISDQVDYIEGALHLVEQNLLIGAFLAALVLLVFLRSFGASAIISISIPVCVFGTLLGMTLLGRTINVVSLAGITFAIGMVVDNSIVSLENIDNWRGRVSDPKEAAFQGVREVWGAILASTATTAAVFVPVIAWQGEVGQILRDVAVAVSFAILTSLWVSVWVIPSLATRLRSKSSTEAREGPGPTRRRRRRPVGAPRRRVGAGQPLHGPHRGRPLGRARHRAPAAARVPAGRQPEPPLRHPHAAARHLGGGARRGGAHRPDAHRDRERTRRRAGDWPQLLRRQPGSALRGRHGRGSLSRPRRAALAARRAVVDPGLLLVHDPGLALRPPRRRPLHRGEPGRPRFYRS